MADAPIPARLTGVRPSSGGLGGLAPFLPGGPAFVPGMIGGGLGVGGLIGGGFYGGPALVRLLQRPTLAPEVGGGGPDVMGGFAPSVPVPEPSGLVVFGLALAVLVLVRLRGQA